MRMVRFPRLPQCCTLFNISSGYLGQNVKKRLTTTAPISIKKHLIGPWGFSRRFQVYETLSAFHIFVGGFSINARFNIYINYRLTAMLVVNGQSRNNFLWGKPLFFWTCSEIHSARISQCTYSVSAPSQVYLRTEICYWMLLFFFFGDSNPSLDETHMLSSCRCVDFLQGN